MMPYNNPQQMTLAGSKTPNVVVYKSESHKLHQAFVVKAGEVIIQGQPVKLNEDGTISGYTGAAAEVYLGVAMTDSVNPAYPGNEVTVAVTGYVITNGLSGAAGLKAGYVKPAIPAEDSIYVSYTQEAADPVQKNFIALNTADQNELIQVLVR